MKKIIAVVLAVFMCLSLAACGDDTANNEELELLEKYDDILDMLEDKDYEDAIREIAKLMEKEASKDNFSDESVDESTKKRYNQIKNWLGSEGYLLSDENGKYLGDKAPEYVYKWLSEHRDYKDCAKYLDKFVVVKDTLSYIKHTQIDAFNQVIEEVDTKYYYDEEGKCYELSELCQTLEALGVEEWGSFVNPEYDNNGKLVGVNFSSNMGDENGRIVCKLKIEYNSSNKVEKAVFEMASGNTWTNIFEYNDKNLLTKATFNSTYRNNYQDDNKYIEEYEYDNQGNLKKKTYIDSDYGFVSSITEYEYDNKGFLYKLSVFSNGYHLGSKFEEICTEIYSYDDKNRISTIDVTERGEKYTLTYVYEDVCIYNRDN